MTSAQQFASRRPPQGRPGLPHVREVYRKEVLINVHKFHYYERDVVLDEIGQLPRFALADIYVHIIDDDHVLASLRQFLVKPTSVACETPNIQGFSLGEQRFLQQIAVVLGFVETLRHVEKLK